MTWLLDLARWRCQRPRGWCRGWPRSSRSWSWAVLFRGSLSRCLAPSKYCDLKTIKMYRVHLNRKARWRSLGYPGFRIFLLETVKAISDFQAAYQVLAKWKKPHCTWLWIDSLCAHAVPCDYIFCAARSSYWEVKDLPNQTTGHGPEPMHAVEAPGYGFWRE